MHAMDGNVSRMGEVRRVSGTSFLPILLNQFQVSRETLNDTVTNIRDNSGSWRQWVLFKARNQFSRVRQFASEATSKYGEGDVGGEEKTLCFYF